MTLHKSRAVPWPRAGWLAILMYRKHINMLGLSFQYPVPKLGCVCFYVTIPEFHMARKGCWHCCAQRTATDLGHFTKLLLPLCILQIPEAWGAHPGRMLCLAVDFNEETNYAHLAISVRYTHTSGTVTTPLFPRSPNRLPIDRVRIPVSDLLS